MRSQSVIDIGCIKIKGIIMALTGLFLTMPVKASGEEPLEESRSEQPENEEMPLFEGFAEMDYCLFLETDVRYGASLWYYRYGIYGDFIRTEQEGEDLYFDLNEKTIGSKLELYTHKEWYHNTKPFIQDISPDLEWVIARQYTYIPVNTDKIYYQGQALEEKEGVETNVIAIFALQKKEDGEAYEQMEDEKIKRWEETIQAAWGWDDAFWRFWAKSISAIDEYGKLLAIAAPDNSGIGIYSMENGEELLHMEIADKINTDWTIEVSQIKGDAESGWIVFSNGDVTYRMTYPEGSMERLGEFMYETTYSPDEKYRAYCTANRDFRERGHFLSDEKYEKWDQVCDRWNAVTPGWYVEELETGKKTYIPIPAEDGMGSIPVRLFDGGRCVWLQKDKLIQTLRTHSLKDLRQWDRGSLHSAER